MELVGIALDLPWQLDPKQLWWSLDGEQIDLVPLRPTSGFLPFPEKVQTRTFLFRFKDLPSDASAPSWEFTPSGSWRGEYKLAYADGIIERELKMVQVQTGAARTATIRVGIGEGKWETVATWKPGHEGKANLSREGKNLLIEYGKAVERTNDPDSTDIQIRHTLPRAWNMRLLTIGKDGKETGKELFDVDGAAMYTLAEVPLSSIKEFQFQVRPYYWAEFGSVELNPQPVPEAEKDAAVLPKTPSPPPE